METQESSAATVRAATIAALIGALLVVGVAALGGPWAGSGGEAVAGGADRSYAGLGAAAEEGFAVPSRDAAIVFPDDLGPHPEFRIEWWYVTANLVDRSGRRYGVQWTLFRQAAAPGPQREGWASQQFWLGHAALTTAERHYFDERFARGGVGQAGVSATVDESVTFEAWIDHWSMSGTGAPGRDAPTEYRLTAAGPSFGYDLTLSTDAGFVLQGEQGYSVKSERGQASHYYSQPFFQASGALTIDDETIEVDGLAWLDREWSSQPLAPDQEGWDWFSLHLDGGDKVMLFQLRDADGTSWTSGNWISADGSNERLPNGAVAMTPRSWTRIDGRDAPTAWTIEIPSRGFAAKTEPLNPESWNDGGFSYWEGPIAISGGASGVGYLEMTGY